jgi:hypothetical protein
MYNIKYKILNIIFVGACGVVLSWWSLVFAVCQGSVKMLSIDRFLERRLLLYGVIIICRILLLFFFSDLLNLRFCYLSYLINTAQKCLILLTSIALFSSKTFLFLAVVSGVIFPSVFLSPKIFSR